MKKSVWLLPLTCLCFLMLQAVGGPGMSGPFEGRRVLFIGIDGLRNDALKRAMATGAAPHLRELVDGGMVTWNAFAGGPLNGDGQQPTMSGPGWASFYTGTWTDRHHVIGNSTPPYDEPATLGSYLVSQAPAFATLLKSVEPQATVASIVSWSWIEDYLVAAQPGAFDYHVKGTGSSYAARDASVESLAVNYLGAADPDVLMLHFDQVDGAGHASGFSASNAAYLQAISNVDQHVGEVMAAVRARPEYEDENWLVVVSTDHGGLGLSHGGQSQEERNIMMVLHGPDIPAGVVSRESVGQPALAPTIFKHLGVAVNPAWQWAEDAFGVAPSAVVTGAGNRASIRILQPAGGQLAGCTGIELYRDSVLVGTYPPDAVDLMDAPTLPPLGRVEISYEVRFLGTTVPPVIATVELANAEGEDLVTDLVADLRFDGSADDFSGRGNHAVVTGSAGYDTGVQGQGLRVNATQFASFPATLADLQFGADTDFTVAFWIRCPNQWSGDPVLLSNKNWNSGSNTGWAIAGQSSAANRNTWQWNFKGAAASRRDFDAGGGIVDGANWHHVAIAHDRDGNASFYADGVLIGQVSIAGSGTVDTGLPLQLGRDGNGGNAMNVEVVVDELKIWRRALDADEVRTLVPEPAADLQSGLVLDLPFDGDANDLSGRNNHGTLVGATAVFEPGRTGSAVRLDPSQYVTLGQATDLQFGASVDFTVSCWVKADLAWTADPALISNKNWASGANTGWFLGGQDDGSTFQWNFRGASASRRDFDNGNRIRDGAWHHLAVAHRRNGNADIYQDGVQVGSIFIGGSGSVDTGLPVNIGRDGSGNSPWSGGILMDDLKVWRRALGAADVAAICPPAHRDWQAWRLESFNDAELADPAISSEEADPDGDGLANFDEFAFGGDPRMADVSLIRPMDGGRGVVFLIPPGGSGDVAGDYHARGLIYRIQRSEDMQTWEPALGHSVMLSTGPGGWLQATLVGASVESPIFYRQQVVK
ncbi:MAG: alkaline phosphatase family protein [Akkermansiaceae bacterium]|jgi:hypothetical protein|nr:alkaline phosphatase family protein [Akkermansiaceae bacterium]